MPTINDYGFPFSDQAGDREYNSEAFRSYFKKLISNGLIQNDGTDCKVKPQEVLNKSVFVDTGTVFINGAMRINETQVNLPCSENISGNTRIDRVVARLNYVTRQIEFAILEGTPAASPSAPALTRNTSIYELALADITLANGYSTITSGVISDKRMDEQLCGFSKTTYMQTFDDENNLLKYSRDVTVLDAAENPTEIVYKRPVDDSLFLKRVYSNPDVRNRYQTITETFYLPDGITLYKTVIYTISYVGAGTVVDTMTRQVIL